MTIEVILICLASPFMLAFAAFCFTERQYLLATAWVSLFVLTITFAMGLTYFDFNGGHPDYNQLGKTK